MSLPIRTLVKRRGWFPLGGSKHELRLIKPRLFKEKTPIEIRWQRFGRQLWRHRTKEQESALRIQFYQHHTWSFVRRVSRRNAQSWECRINGEPNRIWSHPGRTLAIKKAHCEG